MVVPVLSGLVEILSYCYVCPIQSNPTPTNQLFEEFDWKPLSRIVGVRPAQPGWHNQAGTTRLAQPAENWRSNCQEMGRELWHGERGRGNGRRRELSRERKWETQFTAFIANVAKILSYAFWGNTSGSNHIMRKPYKFYVYQMILMFYCFKFYFIIAKTTVLHLHINIYFQWRLTFPKILICWHG